MADDDATPAVPSTGPKPQGAPDSAFPIDQLDEVTRLLAALRTRVRGGKSVPMSASVMVHRKDLLSELDTLAAALPNAFDQARAVLADRDDVIAEGRARADRLIEQARASQAALVTEQAIHQQASSAAQDMVGAATQTAAYARGEVDDYVDKKLASFEVVLTRTLSEVTEGRRQLFEPEPAESGGPVSAARKALRALGRGD